MSQSGLRVENFLPEETGEQVSPAEIEKRDQQQSKIIKLLNGEQDIVWKSGREVGKETTGQRERVRAGIRDGTLGVAEFSRAVDMLVDRNSIERSKNAYTAGKASTEVFILKPEDDKETYSTKRRRVGILMSAVDGGFTRTDPTTRKNVDLREEVVRSPSKTADLIVRFVEKFHSPFDFGEAANATLARRKRDNPTHPEKVAITRKEMGNVLSTIYGEKYEYYKSVKALFDEAFAGTN